jgi:hypothetical protein
MRRRSWVVVNVIRQLRLGAADIRKTMFRSRFRHTVDGVQPLRHLSSGDCL